MKIKIVSTSRGCLLLAMTYSRIYGNNAMGTSFKIKSRAMIAPIVGAV